MSEFVSVFLDVYSDIWSWLLSPEGLFVLSLIAFSWSLGWFISHFVSHFAKVRPGEFRRLRYNIFIDKYTIGGKIVERGEVFLVCFPEMCSSGGCTVVTHKVYLRPTFLHWKLYANEQDVPFKTKINGLYACFCEVVEK